MQNGESPASNEVVYFQTRGRIIEPAVIRRITIPELGLARVNRPAYKIANDATSNLPFFSEAREESSF